MVTKGIITSIDFNGNTCQVRIPLFETAGNDPITGTAIVSNTPGSYNGYKVGDVVLVAFEDGKMQNPVIVGKLYLGAAKEKQDPRGTINVETTTASKSASLPADAVLTANVDSNVPNTNAPFGSLASIANNLNSLNTDVNQLDRFTRNQFNSVITDVNDQGEQLRSEIKQTAVNIEANVVHKHQDGSQKALGWDLTTDSWKINAQDTVTNENGETEVKDINIVTIDRSGMSIAGDLKLNGYPKNIVVKYAQNDSDTTHPALDSTEWSTNVPARVDGKYIWQWTRTEIYSFDKNSNSWNEQDDDKIVCITGAKGDTGTAINNNKQWYILWPANASANPTKPTNNTEPTEPTTPSTLKEWMSMPPEAVNDHVVWTCYGSIFSDDTPENRHIEYSDPVKDNAYALAQGKTTNYYSNTDPSKVYSIKKGDCWFKTISSTNDEYNNEMPDQNQGRLYQCSGFDTDGKAIWEDVGGELVANKLTANYINALDITAKKITVLNNNNAAQSDSNPILFEADGLSGTGSVKIANFTVNQTGLYSGEHNEIGSTKDGVYLGADGISIGSNFKVTAGSVIISDYTKSTIKKYRIIEYDNETDASTHYADWDNWDSSEWLSTIPNREEGKYIWEWTKEVKGNSTDDISTWEDKGKICITGTKGDPGEQGYSIVASVSRPSFTEANWNTYGSIGHSETWNDTSAIRNGCRVGDIFTVVGTATDTKNAHVLYYKSTTASGNLAGTCFSHSVAERGNKGEAGNGISSITNYYLVSNNNSGIVNTSGDWKTVPPTTDDANKYLWNYVLINYTNSDPTKTTPCIIGVHGEKGEPGKTGRSVLSVTKFYKTATSKPNKPSNKTPADWYTSPPAWKTGNNYYESDLTIYDSADSTGQDYSWSDVIENSMLTVDFINSLGITAQGLKVVNGNNTILSANIANETPNSVQIGGFTVDSNRLYAGNPGADNFIELASFTKLLAYKSNNQGMELSWAVSKITVNKATDLLTVYIRSYAESRWDYTIISTPNAPSYPKSDSDSYVKAHTLVTQNSDSTLAGYTEVEYYGLKQNDWIYVVYVKDDSNDEGTDTGYFLIPETADVSISNVDPNYYFVRDSAFDIKGASIKVGTNFRVDNTGAIRSTSGTIGGFTIGNNANSSGTTGGPYIKYGNEFADNSIWLSPGYKTVKQSLTGDTNIRTWTVTSGQNFGVTSNGDLYANNAHIKGDLRTTGYNIGDNTGIWISSAGVTSTTSVGGSPSGTSNTWTIASGDDFGVTSDGKIFTRYGKIGALDLTPATLSAGQRFPDSGNSSFLHINTEENYAPTGWNDRADSATSTLEASSARFNVQILGIESDSSEGDTVIYMDGRHYADNGLVTVYQTQLSDQDNYQVRSRIPITEFEKLPISIGGDTSPYIIPGPKNWNNKGYAPVRIILSGEKTNPETDKWYDMSIICSTYGIIIIDGVATSTIAKASNTSLSGYSQVATAYYENHDLSEFRRGKLTNTSQIPYSSLWIGNDGDGGRVSKISFIITGWAVSKSLE